MPNSFLSQQRRVGGKGCEGVRVGVRRGEGGRPSSCQGRRNSAEQLLDSAGGLVGPMGEKGWGVGVRGGGRRRGRGTLPTSAEWLGGFSPGHIGVQDLGFRAGVWAFEPKPGCYTAEMVTAKSTDCGHGCDPGHHQINLEICGLWGVGIKP